MAYLKFKKSLSENSNTIEMFRIVDGLDNNCLLGSISNFQELCELIDNLKQHYDPVSIFQILLDSFRENDVKWLTDLETKSRKFVLYI